ncbi:peptide chain release factor N(5)-glutamine methyltransferase [Pseudaestuariivita atlantica]|uniref:Release factor glutamine methyltransferase n=1 Tax=Pseudaestuariivita atlantica TaxID=1317121 RepID=A0A0L1JKT0_9RHOB|nr:peptide chain release factor N(5)-glutamine methyltransferase [Pseudaestuariivita atlantica]KNG92364.1 SAM-dependent methyltransferase [Pseudaestuariivita atlantica]
MTAAQALAQAAARLAEAEVPDPARDARRLLAHAAGVDATRVTLMAPEPLPDTVAERFAHLVAQRAARRPVSHLTGAREFYGRRFQVTPQVLDPRPETETLVEAALALPFASVLDLGTGSGAILVTLLAEREHAVGVGTDLSEAACLVASANAVAHGVAARADIRATYWFDGVTDQFDLIVSNPPYIAEAEMAELAPELAHEPRMALTDEGDGLSAYHAIAAGAAIRLAPGGTILVEIGASQGADVCAIFLGEGFETRILSDLDGRDRVVRAIRASG